MKTKNNFERVAFIILLGIFLYLFSSCTTSRIKDKPHYPYYYE